MKVKISKILIYIAIFLPPVIFFYLFFKYTINIPVNDDYRAILDSLNKIISVESVSDKISVIFSQHNEHRIAYDRLWAIICYKINGQVNFNYLSLIGNLSLVGIFFLLLKNVRKVRKELIYLVPLSILVFNITFYENMTFAMAGLSNFTVFLFSLLSLYYLTKEVITKKDLFLSLLFMLFAVYTQGSGVFLIPISILILIYVKQRKQLIVYSCFSLLVIFAYFYGYKTPEYHPSILSTLIDFKVRALLFSLSFLGSAFNYNLIYTNDLQESTGLTAIIGFIFLMIYIYLIKIKYYKKNLFVFSVMSMIVMTAFITGVTRCQFGMETAGASRYRISGVIFLIALYIAFIQLYKSESRFYKPIFILSALIYFGICLRQYEYLSLREKDTMTGVLRYESGELLKLNGFEQDFYNQAIIESSKLGTYYLPSSNSMQLYFPYSKEISVENKEYSTEESNSNIQAIDKIKDFYLIDGWVYFEHFSSDNQEVYIGIKNINQPNIKFFTAKQIPKFDLNPYFKKFTIQNSGFLARIKESDLEKGNNEIYIQIKNGETVKLIKTDKKITN